MENNFLHKRDIRAYIFLTSLVICGLAGCLITAPKIISIGIQFPFSNIVFSILTYPVVGCICELWGKKAARQTLGIGLFCQFLISLIIQISIITPASPTWQLQSAYTLVLSTGLNVVIASLIAFGLSQLLDIFIYQKLKEICNGKKLWIRANLSMFLGQALDSLLFINIVFFDLNNKGQLLLGSILIKSLLSFLMTPVVYLIVYAAHRYLDSYSLAFKTSSKPNVGVPSSFM